MVAIATMVFFRVYETGGYYTNTNKCYTVALTQTVREISLIPDLVFHFLLLILNFLIDIFQYTDCRAFQYSTEKINKVCYLTSCSNGILP